jgi:predicted metal-dependent phosphoesterase TrpH
MTVEEIDQDQENFENELRWLREKYPQFYIEVWGPYDFALQLNDDQYSNGEALAQAAADNWDKWVGVVEVLHDTFDAHVGTNWDRLTQAIKEINRDDR